MSYADFQHATALLIRKQNRFYTLNFASLCAELELSTLEKQNLTGLHQDRNLLKYAHSMSEMRLKRALGAMPLAKMYIDLVGLRKVWFTEFDPHNSDCWRDAVAERFMSYVLERKPSGAALFCTPFARDLLSYEYALHRCRLKKGATLRGAGLRHMDFATLELSYDIGGFQKELRRNKGKPDFTNLAPKKQPNYLLMLSGLSDQPQIFNCNERIHQFLQQERSGGGPLKLEAAELASLKEVGLWT